MSDRPILFSAPMVRAIIEDRKTMTRRLAWRDAEKGAGIPVRSHWQRAIPGDLLWVRETFAVQPELWEQSHAAQPVEFPVDLKYRDEIEDYVFKPSIHMPRWASRLTLEVTAVKIERLQKISEQDAIAEGCVPDDGSLNPNYIGPAKMIFAALWDSINGDGAWGANPEVVVLSFAVYQQNIDAFKREKQAT